jgi:ABC-type amino acid transport substrate-binding protein
MTTGIKLLRIMFVCVFVVNVGLTLASAQQPMRYIYNAPESALDVRYEYHWEILRTALERTEKKWGAFTLAPGPVMSESRQAFELRQATGRLTVMYLSTTREFESTLIPVRIPVDKNLGGYNVFLIRKDRQDRFSNVRSLDDLRRFSIGLGLGWIDVGILSSNGFKVVTGSSYDGLFHMADNKRFDILLRAAVEVLDEYASRRASMPNLEIEERLCLYYPLPMYFWFPKTPEGERLAARAEEGMRAMIADGTYDRIFDKFQRHKILELHLKDRQIFSISNPNVGPETPFADKRLWFDPKTYR